MPTLPRGGVCYRFVSKRQSFLTLNQLGQDTHSCCVHLGVQLRAGSPGGRRCGWAQPSHCPGKFLGKGAVVH